MVLPLWPTIERFFRNKTDCGPSTIQKMQGRYQILIDYIAARDFCEESCYDFLDHLRQARGASNATVKNYILLLKAIGKALKLDFTEELKGDKIDKVQKDVLSPEELSRLIAVYIPMPKKSDRGLEANTRISSLCEFLSIVGMRIDNALNLAERHVKTIDGVECIYIPGNETKTGDEIMLPITESIRACISRPKRYPHGLFFGTADGAMSPQYVNRTLKERAQAADIKKDISSHTFRRSMITNSLNADMPIALVSRLAGHKKLETTMRYYQHKVTDLVKIINAQPQSLKYASFDVMIWLAQRFYDFTKYASDRFPVAMKIDEEGIQITIRRAPARLP